LLLWYAAGEGKAGTPYLPVGKPSRLALWYRSAEGRITDQAVKPMEDGGH
jgi:hypothetical protein